MGAVKEALQLATEVSTMFDVMINDTFGEEETITEFMDWAVEQHANHVCEKIGIERAGMHELLNWADNAFGEVNSMEIAMPLFRYYLQAYKKQKTLTAEQIKQLAVINKARIQIVGAATFIATLPTAKPSADHAATCPECAAL